MREFSSKIIEDLFTDAVCEGYRGLVSGLYELLVKYEKSLSANDYFNIITRLSWCHYYREVEIDLDTGKRSVVWIKDQYLDLWDQVEDYLDARDTIWFQVLTARDRPDSCKYFGKNELLASVCRITE